MSHFDWDDDKLKERMEVKFGTPEDGEYRVCLDILLLRHNERLIDKTAALVSETNTLVRKTWGLAIATWAVAGAMIITMLIQLFN